MVDWYYLEEFTTCYSISCETVDELQMEIDGASKADIRGIVI